LELSEDEVEFINHLVWIRSEPVCRFQRPAFSLSRMIVSQYRYKIDESAEGRFATDSRSLRPLRRPLLPLRLIGAESSSDGSF